MNIWKIFTDNLQGLQEEMGVSIRLTETRRGSLFPRVDLNTGEVLFNTKLRAFVALYNYMLLHPETGCEAVLLYTLYNMYLDTCRYDDADQCLTRLEAELSKIQSAAGSETDPFTAQSVELQVIFILLHECVHMVFHVNRDYRTLILQNVRGRMEDQQIDPSDIPDRIKKYMESFIPDNMPDDLRQQLTQEMHEKMKELAGQIFDFSQYLDPSDDSMLEEFGCDQVACGLALGSFINLNPKGDAVMEAAIEMFMALYILDYDRCFQSIYRGQCAERMVEMPRIAGARHANLRGFIYELFLQHGTREIAREFLRQAEARDEGGKRLILPSVLDHLTDMLVMQHTAEGQPQRSRALPLEQRFARIEAEILRFWGCQHTSPSI